jgi:hypothetical protein
MRRKGIAKKMGWTTKPSYRKPKGYWRVPAVNANSRKGTVRKLCALLEYYMITDGAWLETIARAACV